MFKPDIFSDNVVKFCESPAINREGVREVFELYYPSLGSVKGVFQSSALEINSKNFKVCTDVDVFVLKKIPVEDGIGLELKQQAMMVNELSNKNIKVAEFLLSEKKQHFTFHKEHAWGVMPYYSGSYYSGVANEFLNIGFEVNRFFLKLRDTMLDEPISEIKNFEYADLKSFKEVMGGIESSERPFFSEGVDENILRMSGDIENVMEYFLDSKSAFRIGIGHIDLHPHNVLVNENELLCFLDFDSLKVTDPRTAYLFSIYKLARQAVINNGVARTRKMLNQVLGEAYGLGIIDSMNVDFLTLYSKFEVVRRINYILNLSVNLGSSQWNHVLPIQLASLEEIDILFGIRG